MINYIEQHECELNEFVAWAGGAEILNELLKHDKKELYLLTTEQLMTDYCALTEYINNTVDACGGWTTECTNASDLQARIASVIKTKLSALYN